MVLKPQQIGHLIIEPACSYETFANTIKEQIGHQITKPETI
jgi:hypothetical protein